MILTFCTQQILLLSSGEAINGQRAWKDDLAPSLYATHIPTWMIPSLFLKAIRLCRIAVGESVIDEIITLYCEKLYHFILVQLCERRDDARIDRGDRIVFN